MTTAYMQTHHIVLKSQYKAMEDLCQYLSASTYKLFCHILVCTLMKLTKEGKERFTPVSSKLIDKAAPGAKWEDLSDRGLIDYTGYDIPGGQSREFKTTELVLDLFFELDNIRDYQSAEKVNLFNGKVSRAICKNILTDDTGNSNPPLIQAAMDIFAENRCVYNEDPIVEHLENLREQVRLNPTSSSLVGRYRNDAACWRSVQNQQPEDIGNGLRRYLPAYRAISTGRIHQIKGGLQSCSREMKQAAYSNIPGLRNYDLKSSQSNIAIQLMEEAGVDTSWLCTYRDTANNKKLFAEIAGLSVDNWKTCLLALLMGAMLPGNKVVKESSILDVLAKEANGDPDEIFRLNKSLTKVVSGLDKSLNKWHTWLMKTYIPANQKQGGQERKYYIQNKVEKRLCVSDLPKSSLKAKAKVAAFLLQGQEALFIHRLTVISKQYNYKPIANEHDGLICIGDIPSEAISEAASFSGLKYAMLEDKPFMA